MKKEDNIYFANLDDEEVTEQLYSKVEKNSHEMSRIGYYNLLSKAYNAYYGLSEDGSFHASSTISFEGRQGELSSIKVNETRNMVQHVLVMTTSQQPTFMPVATNTDPDSMEQTVLAKGVLEYYMSVKKLGRKAVKAAEYALVFGEGFVSLEWDTSLGAEYGRDPSTNQMVYTGDVKACVFSPFDVIRDVARGDEEGDWIIYREWVNRYDLVATYPDQTGKILELPGKFDELQNLNVSREAHPASAETDEVALYTFYHKRTPAVPEGRVVQFSSANTMYFSGPLPYESIPVYRISPSDVLGTVFGYTSLFDGLSLQKAIDAIFSIVLSNQSAFGVQTMWVPEGSNIDYQMLAEGLSVIQTPPGQQPVPLQFTSTPREVFTFMELLKNQMEINYGINSVVRGQPEASLKSGAALALVQAMALQFNSGYQRSWFQMNEDLANGLLNILKTYASAPQMLSLIGKKNKPYVKAFTGDELGGIMRVTVEAVSPLSQTTPGKLEIANNLLQNQVVTNYEDYVQVLNTGRLEPLSDPLQDELLLIDRENEELREGRETPVVPTDNHPRHITRHNCVLSSPEVRRNPALRQVAMAHMQEHIRQWSETDPNLLMSLGIPPLQPPVPPGGPVPPGPESNPQAVMQGGSEPASSLPSMPNQPKNPATGETADLPAPQGEIAPGIPQ